LSYFELSETVKKLKEAYFPGVFLRDTLTKTSTKNECGSMKLDDSSAGGTHWVCWLKCEKNGKKEKWYFYSFGLPTPTELGSYLGGGVFCPTAKVQPRQEFFGGHLRLFF